MVARRDSVVGRDGHVGEFLPRPVSSTDRQSDLPHWRLTQRDRIWALGRGFTNLVLTQLKPVSRTRVGAKVIKRPAAAATPHQWVVDAGVLTPAQRGALTRTRNARHPGHLQREIDRLCQQLERLSLEKRPAPRRPVNRSFTASPHPELLREATNQSSRRI